MSLEQRKLVSEPLLEPKESNKEKFKAARLLAKNHSENLNCANLLQRKLHGGRSFKQRAVFNGFLHDFFNAKIHDAGVNSLNTNP
jgi:hypothetical protein